MLEGPITLLLLAFLIALFVFVTYVGGGWFARKVTPSSWWEGGPLSSGERRVVSRLVGRIEKEMGLLMRMIAYREITGDPLTNDHRSDVIRDGWKYRDQLLELTIGGSPFHEARADAERWLTFVANILGPYENSPFASVFWGALSEPSIEELEAWVASGRIPARWASTLRDQ